MVAFVLVLRAGGWSWGEQPSASVLALASGAAFAAISLGQMANAFACRSESRPAWLVGLRRNLLLLGAVATEAVLLAVFLGVPFVSALLGGAPPPAIGWAVAGLGAVALLLVDALRKRLAHRSSLLP